MTTVQPLVWLGAPSPGGLALPDASPAPERLYAPRGVCFDEHWFVAADSGNHRLLLWQGLPEEDARPADVVLGQPTPWHEGPRAAGRGPENGLHLPTGVLFVEGRLVVADAWHHRLLVWEQVPRTSDTPPDYALGQADLASVEPNRGGAPDGTTLYWPYGLAWLDGRLYVADTGNRRVLAWQGFPEPGRPADLVLGQPDPGAHDENRCGPVAADSFRWPHAIAGSAERLWVADAGNHRLLGWEPAPESDRPAERVLGQRDFTSAREMPHQPPGPSALRFPYGASVDGERLAVADTANNRVLLWERPPAEPAFAPADQVLGQADFAGGGENRWQAVRHDTLCWPYGVWLHGDRLAVADSGNNRVLIWRVPRGSNDRP